MKARVKWVEGRTFIGEAGTGHSILFGGLHGDDGYRPGPTPMELLLIGTAGCSSFDVIHILERGREPIEDCTVDISGERAETDPKIFTKIHMHFVVKGRGLDRKKVDRAVQLSLEKYCSASAMMAKAAEITHEIEVVDTTAG